MTDPDHELISECLSGRTEAFDRLMVRHQDRLFNTLSVMLGSADDARDVVQDAFLQAFQKLGAFRRESAFYSWLFRIAVNAAASRKRKQRRIRVSVEAAREKGGLEPFDLREDANPGYAMEVSEKQELVREALAELSEEYRAVLVLKELEGLKYEEIAELIDIPLGTVRSRIHRARCELRQKLRGFFTEEE